MTSLWPVRVARTKTILGKDYGPKKYMLLIIYHSCYFLLKLDLLEIRYIMRVKSGYLSMKLLQKYKEGHLVMFCPVLGLKRVGALNFEEKG